MIFFTVDRLKKMGYNFLRGEEHDQSGDFKKG